MFAWFYLAAPVNTATLFSIYYSLLSNNPTLRNVHNITAKAALKFGSEAWVLKKREEQRLEETKK
jgi:hypothetical protein